MQKTTAFGDTSRSHAPNLFLKLRPAVSAVEAESGNEALQHDTCPPRRLRHADSTL